MVKRSKVNRNKNKKKNIYYAHIVMNNESEVAGRSMLIVSELGYEVRLEVVLETV